MKKYKTKSKDPETAIERFCLQDCCGGDREERDHCKNKYCQLWGFRIRQGTLPKEEDLSSVVAELIEWNEKFPPNNIYSHDRIILIASEMNKIYQKAKVVVHADRK